MTEYSLEFIGRTLVDLHEESCSLAGRVAALERTVGEVKVESMVNTAKLLRNFAEYAR